MRFAELYNQNITAVENALRSLWCNEPSNNSQRNYNLQIKGMLRELFAPSDAFPVVQCTNSYKPVNSVSDDEAKAIVAPLWKAPYSPYEHQYQCWNTLLNETTTDSKPQSICVTTGTGSGKTECFMLPLVYDLIHHHKSNQIQALFLYPLNALMEDQKERLEEILANTDLKYTVYNADLPEKEPNPTSNSDVDQISRRNIEQITGGTYTKIHIEGKRTEWVLEGNKYPHMLYTRQQVRQTPPNILLTNPTMLEYILLRGSDDSLINPEKKSLRWVAIDETHSYTGAGAAELAMLLRRILIAFNCKAENIRFATSSATFGNGKEDEAKLQAFISGITGTNLNQIKIVNGERIGEKYIPEGQDHDVWKQIFEQEYVSLEKLYPGNDSIEEKLAKLDAMCQREEDRCAAKGQKVPDMKVKVHFYYRVPNNGLYIKLNEHKNGQFKIFSTNGFTDKSQTNSELPMLELSRCRHCGEYVAVGKVDIVDGKVQALESNDSDMFDLVDEEEDENKDFEYAFFALSKTRNEPGDDNVICRIDNSGRFTPCLPGEVKADEWHIVANTHYKCPHCGSKQASNTSIEAEELKENLRLRKFRISADFISRLISPSVLNQLDKGEAKNGAISLHDGQQFISFVDSRQAAAKTTLSQNLEQERLWFYNVIFQGLCKRQAEQQKIKDEIEALNKQMQNLDDESEEYDDLFMQRRKMRKKLRPEISWNEVAELISKDEYCDTFCNLFVKHSRDSEELDENGEIEPFVKEKYIQSLMVMYLANKISTAASNENMGLFLPCYPQLKKIKELPEAVKDFNKAMQHEENTISLSDWQNLLQIFMDYTVRSNQSFFLRLADNNPIDIFSSLRFATEKQRRRPATKPKIEEGKISTGRIMKYLSDLIAKDDLSLSIDEAQKQNYGLLSGVIDALWDTVTDKNNNLLQVSTRWDEEKRQHKKDKEEDLRLNLADLSFKLFDNVYLCDANTSKGGRHAVRLRPIENHFKGYSPYLDKTSPIKLKEEYHENWATYPYKKRGEEWSVEELHEWAKENRKIIWNNQLWGEEGIFKTYLDQIYRYPNLFLQAEHTAQVDKAVARRFQAGFKNHEINILACSTTMEMGVDLGNLEVVLLSSVPPMPANYKQRAGRSGRNNKVRSACVTLCSSDVIGLRTLYNPIEKIINRPVNVPTIDLMSPQVIQRHVNSFLIHAFGVFKNGENGGRLGQKVIDYYTPYIIKRGSDRRLEIRNGNETVEPTAKLGDETGTMYELFNKKCGTALSTELRKSLKQLLKGTIYDDRPIEVVKKAKEENERCYAELYTKAEDIAFPLQNEKINEKFRTKLRMEYLELLNERLLNFWATNRFTPNANMPVNVLTLDINTSNKSFYTATTSSNPSYSLKQAIAQYAPGNSIAVDGVVYTVRGVSFTNMYKDVSTFKKIYRNADKTVINDKDSLTKPIPWFVNDKQALELIQPVSFLPDMNEEKSRIMEQNPYTLVNAQLIDTDIWSNVVTEPLLFSVRNNRETGAAKILYYNEGRGHGYCFCTRCGRMVLEDEVAGNETELYLPLDFNPVFPKRKEDENIRPKFHFSISGRDYRRACPGSYDSSLIKRNVIIGDLIQTDFSEIRIRHKGDKKWISERDNEKDLLFTLGIVFTQVLADLLGKERNAIDFTITPNGHLCLFDTNPGGAGYANQLSDSQLMKDVIYHAEILLNEAKRKGSKDALLDKFTLRYLKYVNVDIALNWIEEERQSEKIIPKEIKENFPYASETTLNTLLEKSEKSYKEITLFADNVFFDKDIEGWNYDDPDEGWKAMFYTYFSKNSGHTKFCMTRSSSDHINEPLKEMLRDIKGWAIKGVVEINNPYAEDNIYPIAYIDDCLYFTNNREHASLNVKWAHDPLYVARCENPAIKGRNIDLHNYQNTILFKLEGEEDTNIWSKDLGKIIYRKSKEIVDEFIRYATSSNEDLHISYQDEHLKSVFGMILTLQTIEFFTNKMDKHFSLEFLVEKYSNLNSRTTIMNNIQDSGLRDEYLKDLANQFVNKYNADFINLESKERKVLTHWRVLSLKCGQRTLNIYPDGGFANGWFIDKENAKQFYDRDNSDISTNIPIMRVQDLKFEVDIEKE